MARNFLAYPFAPYQGAYSSKAFNSGRGLPKGVMVALNILWATYLFAGAPAGTANPNVTVNAGVNVAGPNVVSAQWTIESCYIDNEGVDFPVYIYFPSTGFTVSCPPNAAGWYQVFTNDRSVLISAVGVSDSAMLQNQQTRIFFTDVTMTPSLDQELQGEIIYGLASPAIAQGNFLPTSGIGVPALGDQIIGVNTSYGAAPISFPQFSNKPNQFVYFTQLQVYCSNIATVHTGVINFTSSIANIFSINTNIGVASQVVDGIIFDMRGNFKFDASLNYSFEAHALSGSTPIGFVRLTVAYTLNPR